MRQFYLAIILLLHDYCMTIITIALLEGEA